MRLSPRTWAKVTIGVLVIGGVLVTLWALNRPTVGSQGSAAATPSPAPPPPLRAARARLVVTGAGAPRRATLRCRRGSRAATGFWSGSPAHGCDALASASAALLSGPGCTALKPGRVHLHVTGTISGRRFDYRAQRGGCPDARQWLAVNILSAPVVRADQQLDEAHD
jgi:hypothetical protein